MALTLGPVIGQLGQRYTTHTISDSAIVTLPVDERTLVALDGSAGGRQIDMKDVYVAVVAGPTVTVKAARGSSPTTVYLVPL